MRGLELSNPRMISCPEGLRLSVPTPGPIRGRPISIRISTSSREGEGRIIMLLSAMGTRGARMGLLVWIVMLVRTDGGLDEVGRTVLARRRINGVFGTRMDGKSGSCFLLV